MTAVAPSQGKPRKLGKRLPRYRDAYPGTSHNRQCRDESNLSFVDKTETGVCLKYLPSLHSLLILFSFLFDKKLRTGPCSDFLLHSSPHIKRRNNEGWATVNIGEYFGLFSCDCIFRLSVNLLLN